MIKYIADVENLANSMCPILESIHTGRIGKILVISSGLWDAIMKDVVMCSMLDPVTRWSEVQKGHVATVFGLEVCTDGYLEPEKQFLSGLEWTLVDGWEEYTKLVPPVENISVEGGEQPDEQVVFVLNEIKQKLEERANAVS